MPTCELGFDHPEPEPEIIVEEAPDVEPVAEASVEIARIEADRDVQTAKIYAKGEDADTAALIAALQARIEVLEQSNMPPEPEPIPVVVDPPAPAPQPEPEAPVATDMPPAEPKEPKAKKRTARDVFWS